ncbi:MAG: isoprenylcysteine carboxylmethyltransferase family protein [Alphaproteobacteria bacterium]
MPATVRDNPGVIAPPPLIFLGFLLLGLVLDALWPLAILPDVTQYLLGIVLFGLGIGLSVTCIAHLRRLGTDFRTHKPASTLVTDGPYRVSRNPIYIALSLVHIGIAVAVDSPWMLAMLIPALAVVRIGVIAREERYLEASFGDDYRRYRASVRRWL